MADSLKEIFNELIELDNFFSDWAAICLRREEIHLSELVKDLEEYQRTLENPVGAEELAAYLAVKKRGPEEVGYDKSVQIFKRFLSHIDGNMRVIIPHVGDVCPRQLLEKEFDTVRLNYLADKHKVHSIRYILP